MRYSRFKKGIDGPAPTPRPRNPNSPRKTKVEKNKSPKKEKVKNWKESDDAEKLKGEVGVAGSSHNTPVEGTPEVGIQPGSMEPSLHGSVEGSPFFKGEPGSSNSSRYASTPFEESTTPASSFNGGAGEMNDKYFTSFGMPIGENEYEPMMAHGVMGQQQYSMRTHMDMGDGYPGLWGQQHNIQTEGDVLVKREPRWEPTYRQV